MRQKVDIVQVFKQAPRYLSQLLLGLLVAVLSSPPITMLAFGAVFWCLVFNVWIVLGITCVVYVVIFTINNVADAIGTTNGRIAGALLRLAERNTSDK